MEPEIYQPYNDVQNDEYSVRLRRLKMLGIGLAILLVGFITYSFYRSTVFHVVSTNPNIGDVSTMSPFFKVSFNKQLSTSSVSITSTDNVVTSHQVKDKVLTLVLKEPMEAYKHYTITIQSITSTGGSQITNKSFIFAPQEISFTSLPKDQQNALNSKDNDGNVTVKQDPVLNGLPHSTLYYSLDAAYPADKNGQTHLVLQAQILLAPGLTDEQASTDTAAYEQQVVAYIQSLGVNPANYTIQYQIVHESISGP